MPLVEIRAELKANNLNRMIKGQCLFTVLGNEQVWYICSKPPTLSAIVP